MAKGAFSWEGLKSLINNFNFLIRKLFSKEITTRQLLDSLGDICVQGWPVYVVSEYFFNTVLSLLGYNLGQDRWGRWSTIGFLSGLGINHAFLLYLSLLHYCSSVFFITAMSHLLNTHRLSSHVLLDEISILVINRHIFVLCLGLHNSKTWGKTKWCIQLTYQNLYLFYDWIFCNFFAQILN